VNTIYEKAVENAIKLASWVQGFVKEVGKDAEKYGSSFRTRARSFPELMESSGFLPAFTFFYAKATEDTYRKLCELVDDGKIEVTKVKEVKDEEFGYAVYLHGLSAFLQELKLILDHKCPVYIIKELKEANRLVLARNLLLPYLLEVKKLSEALFKGGRE